jgi:hypothetical protein
MKSGPAGWKQKGWMVMKLTRYFFIFLLLTAASTAQAQFAWDESQSTSSYRISNNKLTYQNYNDLVEEEKYVADKPIEASINNVDVPANTSEQSFIGNTGYTELTAETGGGYLGNGLFVTGHTNFTYANFQYGLLEDGLEVRQDSTGTITRRFTLDENMTLDLVGLVKNFDPSAFNEIANGVSTASMDVTCRIILQKVRAHKSIVPINNVDTLVFNEENITPSINVVFMGEEGLNTTKAITLTATQSNSEYDEYYDLTGSIVLGTSIENIRYGLGWMFDLHESDPNYNERVYKSEALNGPFQLGTLLEPVTLEVTLLEADGKDDPETNRGFCSSPMMLLLNG